MEQGTQKYRMVCTLTFGDIYGQIIVWLIVIFITLASALALWSTTRQIYALATVGIVLLLSLPFLVFAFVTTLLNHIEFMPLEEGASTRQFTPGGTVKGTQKPAQAAG
ncbi:conserved hypothetical protein [Gloeothece citriformis PCC 7424]|uniref:Uncharacterized protein n=1 Tax=Gloeothece citriformis (strain PCC 7424) TaxID=65393 RepID=B7K7G1_GLOC7|nr:hypothetical protein [Gloeothece citriformis]ACK69729.1 conserved hypothetical protein [Gloeothece citriformis PCC 7424]